MAGRTAPEGAAEPDDRLRRVRAQVAAHEPIDGRERSAKEQALVFLDRLPRPLEAVDPTHVTASAVVVGRRGVLLHRHRKLGRWMQPGGHLDPAEEPAEAAVRECREETGLSVTHPWGEPRLVHLDVHAAAAGHVHIDLRYLVEGPDARPEPEPGESPEVAWVSWDEAEALADEALAGALSV
ncbi:MAG: NUDIX domain-containing protein, partial [Acidimicrobiales bacterium]